MLYQGTIQNESSKFPPPESLHAKTRVVMDSYTVWKVTGRLLSVWRTSKLSCWSVP